MVLVAYLGGGVGPCLFDLFFIISECNLLCYYMVACQLMVTNLAPYANTHPCPPLFAPLPPPPCGILDTPLHFFLVLIYLKFPLSSFSPGVERIRHVQDLVEHIRHVQDLVEHIRHVQDLVELFMLRVSATGLFTRWGYQSCLVVSRNMREIMGGSKKGVSIMYAVAIFFIHNEIFPIVLKKLS